MADLDIISHTCPSCGHSMSVPAISAGASVTCPQCKETHPVRKPTTAAAPAGASAPAATGDDKRLFNCSGCGYRARIPSHYVGMAVRCPNCNAPQIASGEESGPSTGQTVMVKRLQEASIATPTPTRSAVIRPGHLLYTCNLCGFEAQFAVHYLNKAIRCPGCHAAQVVAEGVTAKLSPMTTPRDGTNLSAPETAALAKAKTPPPQPLFICSACGYRARVPEQYLGMAVTCPSCDVVQIANAHTNEGPTTGNTARIQRMTTSAPVEPVTPASDARIPFCCPGCGFNTQLGRSLAGKAIRCPSCQSTQIVPPLDGTSAPPPAKPATDRIVATASKASPIPAALSQPGGDKIRFICTSCQFKARIPAHYAGQVIHCPGCHRIQLVQALSGTGATGGTQTLNRVETAPGNRPAATAGDELPRVSSALEPSDTNLSTQTGTSRTAAEDRNLQPTTDTMARSNPGTGSHQRPTTRATNRPAPQTATVAKPATTSRITKHVFTSAPTATPVAPPVAPVAPAATPVAAPAAAPQPSTERELSPSTDRHRPGSAAIMPSQPRSHTLKIAGITIAVSVLAILGLMLYKLNQLQQQNERLDQQRKEEQAQAKAAEDRRLQELALREKAERSRADMERVLTGLQDQLQHALERVAQLQTAQAAPTTATPAIPSASTTPAPVESTPASATTPTPTDAPTSTGAPAMTVPTPAIPTPESAPAHVAAPETSNRPLPTEPASTAPTAPAAPAASPTP